MWIEFIVPAILMCFIVYFLYSVSIDYGYRFQINIYLYTIYMFFSFLAIFHYSALPLYQGLLIVAFIAIGLFTYLYQVKLERFLIDHPSAYLIFYFAITAIVLLSGMSQSLLFPGAYILAVLFASTHSGRKVSMAVSIMCIATIILIALTNQINMVLWVKIMGTFTIIIVLPQLHGFIFRERVRKARAQVQEKESEYEVQSST